jgi:hypothetical protein
MLNKKRNKITDDKFNKERKRTTGKSQKSKT